MKHWYLVDSENVNDNWIMLLDLMQDDDELIVFYTKNSPHMSYSSVIKLLNTTRVVNFIEVFEGNNALDFQLVSQLGYLIRDNKDLDFEFNIMSNDTGFDSVVKFWTKNGINIKRISVNYCKLQISEQNLDINTLDTIEESSIVSESDSININTSIQNIQKLDQQDIFFNKKEVDTIICCFGKNNLVELHNALVQIYGNQNGNDIYKKIKEKSYTIDSYTWDRKEKIKQFCNIVFKYSPLDMPNDFSKFLFTNIEKCNNLNTIRPVILKQYGNETGLKYYSLFRGLLKTMGKIN